MTEYRFDHPAAAAEGRVLFVVRNQGRLEHELVLVRLPAHLPPLDEELHARTRRLVEPVFYLRGRVSGESGAFAVDLSPGRYGLICFRTGPGEKQHALKGMNSELTVH